MKIAFLIGTNGHGGLELNQIKTAVEMHKLGHEAYVLINQGSPILENLILEKIQIIRIKKHKNHYDFIRAIHLIKTLKKNRIEHLVIRSVFDMSIAASVKFYLKNRIKVHYFMEMQMLKNKKAWFRTFRYSFFDSWVCPLDYMVEQVKKNTKFPISKIFQIPSGVEDMYFNDSKNKEEIRMKLNLPQNKVIIGLVGRFDPKKNQLLALKALKEANDNRLLLVMIGKPTPNDKNFSYLNEITEFVEKNELKKNVLILGHKMHVSVYFQSFDWTLVPSENESVGMVTLESLATGTPVMGSDSGGTKEILLNAGGVLFNIGQIEDLVDTLKKAANNELTFNKSKIKTFISNNRFSIVAKRLEQHFQQF